MIEFFFKTNKSFIKYSNHPITIPRQYNSALVETVYGDSGKKTIPIKIIPPKGRDLDGEIYYGESGWGPYYQIKTIGNYPGYYLGNLKVGDDVLVTIKRSDSRIDARITPLETLREVAQKFLNGEKNY